MSNDKHHSIRIELTTEHQKQMTEASAVEVSALELTAQELEQRIAPADHIELLGWSFGH